MWVWKLCNGIIAVGKCSMASCVTFVHFICTSHIHFVLCLALFHVRQFHFLCLLYYHVRHVLCYVTIVLMLCVSPRFS